MEVLQMQYVAMPYCNALLQCLAINQATNSVFVFHPFRYRSAVVTKRWFTDNGDVCLGRMVGYLWAVLDP